MKLSHSFLEVTTMNNILTYVENNQVTSYEELPNNIFGSISITKDNNQARAILNEIGLSGSTQMVNNDIPFVDILDIYYRNFGSSILWRSSKTFAAAASAKKKPTKKLTDSIISELRLAKYQLTNPS